MKSTALLIGIVALLVVSQLQFAGLGHCGPTRRIERVEPLAAARPSDDVKKILPDAEGIKKSSRKLSKESVDAIEKALGRKMLSARPVVYEAKATVGALGGFEKVRVVVTFVETRGPKGVIRIGVAAVPEDKIVAGVAILKNDDDKAVEAPEFLVQFEGFEYSTALHSPPSALEEARKKAEGKDDEARSLKILLRLNRDMRQEVQVLWDELLAKIEKEDKSAVKELDELRKEVDEISGFSAKVPFMDGSRQDRYNRMMKAMGNAMGSLRSEIAAGRFNEAYKEAGEITKNYCSKCHASNQRFFRQQRTSTGIGNGFFEIGLDVTNLAPGKEEVVKAVLSAIREGVLVLAEAK